MLMSESLEIGEMIREAMINRYGEELLLDHYRAFETICSATQDRQDAIKALLDEREFDLAIVIGGYNSSNTKNLARICAQVTPNVPCRRFLVPHLEHRDPPSTIRRPGSSARWVGFARGDDARLATGDRSRHGRRHRGGFNAR